MDHTAYTRCANLLYEAIQAHATIYSYKPGGVRMHPQFRKALLAELTGLVLPNTDRAAERVFGLPVIVDWHTPGGLFVLTEDDTRPDALTGILARRVAEQEGRCLTCNDSPALYCGLHCANQGR